MTKTELAAKIEALLFVATEPTKLSQLANALEVAEEDAVAALDTLKVRLQAGGLRLSHTHNTYQLVTAPSFAPIVEHFLGNQMRTDLSRPSLETLAIIIYRQPVTKHQIDSIRGIASDQTIKNLLLRDLVIEAGFSNEPGRPVLYRPSHRLLHHLGITSFDQLPDFDSLSADHDAT